MRKLTSTAFRNLEIYDLVLRLQNMYDFAGPTNSSTLFWNKYLNPPTPAKSVVPAEESG